MVDEFSDLAPQAAFDVRPYASILNEVVLAHNPAFALPRKLKIGLFSTTDGNAARFQDIAFTAVATGGGRAFEVHAGGGMGRESRMGVKIFSELPEQEIFRCVIAGIDLFHDRGNREKRNKARLRFVLERLGEREFVRLYRRYFERASAPEAKLPSTRLTEASSTLPEFPRVERADADFVAWLEATASPTRYRNVLALKISLPEGYLKQCHLAPLARLAKKFAGGKLRVLRSQDLLLPGIHETALPYLYDEMLQGELAAFPAAARRCRITSCVGARICKIGILDSTDIADAVARELDALFQSLPEVSCRERSEITGSIRISGCPNACSCHPAAGLGFEGLKRDFGKGLEPCFRVYRGGCSKGADSRLAVADKKLLPATALTEFVADIVRDYLSRRDPGESFVDFLHRTTMYSL